VRCDVVQNTNIKPWPRTRRVVVSRKIGLLSEVIQTQFVDGA